MSDLAADAIQRVDRSQAPYIRPGNSRTWFLHPPLEAYQVPGVANERDDLPGFDPILARMFQNLVAPGFVVSELATA